MNIRFRMPRLWDDIRFQGTFKEILLSTIATTISIILTFGTAHYVEEKGKRATARQTAMMVIHDMENNIVGFQNMAKDEQKYREMTQYVMEHISEMNSIDIDTLWQVYNYIAASTDQVKLYTLDESSERLFLSSQESWKNIDNATFIDEVQLFYTGRHEIYDYLNSSVQWKKPISSQVLYQHQLNREDGLSDVPQLLKEVLPSKEVRFYLNYSTGRQSQLNGFVEHFQHISNVCKFAMGITDEELEDYVQSRTRTGRNVKDRELASRWIMQSSDDQDAYIEFNDDYTYSQTNINHVAYPIYDGRVDFKYVTNGTWELRGDSLYTKRTPKFKFEMDRSQAKAKPGMEKDVEEYLEGWVKYIKKQQKESAAAEVQVRAYEATINASGNKIELKWVECDDEGNERTQAYYLSREKDE